MGYQQKKSQEHPNVFQRVTNYVIDQLEKGDIPWHKGWNCYGPPKNFGSDHLYHGWNSFFLNHITATKQYRTPFYLTYNQALEMGGCVKRNQHGYPVIYWKKITTDYKALKGGINEFQEKEYPKTRLLLKVYTVFNIDQTTGIDYELPITTTKTFEEKIKACELVVQNMPKCPPIRHGGDNAKYFPGMDYIQMPHLEQFHCPEFYYQTLFHELTHSTGHPYRLHRKELEFFIRGDERYAKEELTAELGAAYLCAYAGIEQTILKNTSAYINNWLQRLKNDKTVLIKAASQAQAAVNFILDDNLKEKVELTDVKHIAI